MIETIKIGHMIGPPLMKLSTRKFLLNTPPPVAAGAGEAVGEAPVLAVAGEVPAAGDAPSAGDVPGTAGDPDIVAPGAVTPVVLGGMAPAGAVMPVPVGPIELPVVGELIVAPVGGAVAANEEAGLDAPAGAGGAGGVCANEVTARAIKGREVVSSLFIVGC
jgi:hypothetical protein